MSRRTCARLLRVLSCVLGVSCGAAPAAHADWMIGGFLGHPWTQSSTATLSQPAQQTQLTIGGIRYRSESFKAPQYYGYRVSWLSRARPWLGIEGELVHAKVFAETHEAVHLQGTLRGVPVDATRPMSSVVQRLAMSHGLNFIFVNLAIRHQLNDPTPRGRRVVGVFRVGAGPTLPHAESTINGVDREQYERGGLGAQVTGALEFDLWRGLGLQGEYKYTWATPEIDVVDGTATVPSRSHHLAGGLTYRF